MCVDEGICAAELEAKEERQKEDLARRRLQELCTRKAMLEEQLAQRGRSARPARGLDSLRPGGTDARGLLTGCGTDAQEQEARSAMGRARLQAALMLERIPALASATTESTGASTQSAASDGWRSTSSPWGSAVVPAGRGAQLTLARAASASSLASAWPVAEAGAGLRRCPARGPGNGDSCRTGLSLDSRVIRPAGAPIAPRRAEPLTSAAASDDGTLGSCASPWPRRLGPARSFEVNVEAPSPCATPQSSPGTGTRLPWTAQRGVNAVPRSPAAASVPVVRARGGTETALAMPVMAFVAAPAGSRAYGNDRACLVCGSSLRPAGTAPNSRPQSPAPRSPPRSPGTAQLPHTLRLDGERLHCASGPRRSPGRRLGPRPVHQGEEAATPPPRPRGGGPL